MGVLWYVSLGIVGIIVYLQVAHQIEKVLLARRKKRLKAKGYALNGYDRVEIGFFSLGWIITVPVVATMELFGAITVGIDRRIIGKFRRKA